jgi:hypothetical protein
LVNKDNEITKVGGGNDTVDQVFLLSYDEALLYLPTDSDRIASETEYTMKHGHDGYLCDWWLRSPGMDTWYADVISMYGEIFADRGGIPVNTGVDVAVRPAI